MSPDQIERYRASFDRIVAADRWRDGLIAGCLIAIGAPLMSAVLLGRAGHGSDRVAAVVLGALTLGLGAGFVARQLRLRAVGIRLWELAARPDLIVWIYEQKRSHGGRTICNIYVCSRRGERLRLTAQGRRRREVLGLLAGLAPRAPRGFSPAREAAFERDPLSVASA
jgi:hypothetical protein